MNYLGKIKEKESFSFTLFLLSAVDIAIQRVFLTGPTVFSLSLFVVMVKAMTVKFEVFNRFFEECIKKNNQLTASMVRNWRINRCDLHDMMSELDDLFSPAALVWITFFVLGTCVETMRIFSGKLNNSLQIVA